MCQRIKVNAAESKVFHKDPTKTFGIRKRWVAQYNIRFRALKGRINKLLLKDDPGAIPVPVINQFDFTSDPTKVAEFMSWLALQVDDLLFTNDATFDTHWQNKFIDQAYVRAIKATRADLSAQGLTAEMLQGIVVPDIIGTATPSLGVGLTSALGTIQQPIHLEAIRLLYIRDFQALRGVTDEMSKQISRVLVEGIEQGLGVRKLARLINDRVDKIGITRARLLARTETVRSYNIGGINEWDDIAGRIGITPMYVWLTAGDDRVRSSHVSRHRQLYTKEQILTLIGEPNCRCSHKAHFDEALLQKAA